MQKKLKIILSIIGAIALIALMLLGFDLIVTIIVAIIFGLIVLLLIKKWGKRFWYILLGGFGIYVMEAKPGIGLGIAFVIIMSYLVHKFGDFKKI